MTEFLQELTDLFTEKKIPNIIEDFKRSSFFRDHYLTQTFKKIVKNKSGEKVEIQPSRFKKKSFYLNKTTGYPIQLNQELTKKLKTGEELKVIKENKRYFSTYIKKWKGLPNDYLQFPVTNNEVFNEPLKVLKNEFRETKELKMFIDGSNENPEQFETWSAEKMYKQWLLLRLSDIEKPNWPIMDYVFFLFINQISCILNSYILYDHSISSYNGTHHHSIVYSERIKYIEYLQALDLFTTNGGLYKDLLDVHFLFCEWFDIRIKDAISKEEKRLVKINKKNDKKINDLFKKNNGETAVTFRTIKTNNGTTFGARRAYDIIRDEFKKTLSLTNFYLLILTSYFQNPKKSNQLYASPVISILGIPYKTHNGFIYSPRVQLLHDYNHVNRLLIPHFDYLYPETTNSNKKIDDTRDTRIFFEKMLFLMKLNESNINKKELDNAHYFLWWYLHERDFLYISDKFPSPKNTSRHRAALFFDISLFKIDLEKLRTLIREPNFNDNIENFNQLTSSIELLIQVCNETLDDPNKTKMFNQIKEETIQRYNTNNNKAVYNDINAVKGNINNTNSYNTNKLDKHIDKYLRRHPELTNEMLNEYTTNNQIRKMYKLSNTTTNIKNFKNDFIRRVKYKDEIRKNISNYIEKYISSHPDLTNKEFNKLQSLLQNKNKLEKLKNSYPNSSNLELLQKLLNNFSNKHVKPKSLSIFAESALGSLNGLPLTNKNFSNQ